MGHVSWLMAGSSRRKRLTFFLFSIRQNLMLTTPYCVNLELFFPASPTPCTGSVRQALITMPISRLKTRRPREGGVFTQATQ